VRHAIKELKETREYLKNEQDVPRDLRTEAHRQIDQAVTQLEKALDYVK
jgi:hypothetical protein